MVVSPSPRFRPESSPGSRCSTGRPGTFTEQLNPDLQFRSASVVKLLIALDYLWDRGPAYDDPAADRVRLDVMLRSSDDDAASYYWDQLGGGRIIDRMVPRLGLTHTAPAAGDAPGLLGLRRPDGR